MGAYVPSACRFWLCSSRWGLLWISGSARPLAQVYPLNIGLSGSPVTLVSLPSVTVASTPQCAEQMRQMPGASWWST